MSTDVSLKQALVEVEQAWREHVARMNEKQMFEILGVTRTEVTMLRLMWTQRWLEARAAGRQGAPAPDTRQLSAVEQLSTMLLECPVMNASTCFVAEIEWRRRAKELIDKLRTENHVS